MSEHRWWLELLNSEEDVERCCPLVFRPATAIPGGLAHQIRKDKLHTLWEMTNLKALENRSAIVRSL